MEIIPAIDIRDGRCVRLLQGDPGRMLVYGDDPVEMARRWVLEGARRLHVVDLDGAFLGRPVHLELVEAIAGLGVPVQVGGGFRTLDDLKAALAAGAERVIVSTAAFALTEEAGRQLGDELVVAIDVKDGQVVFKGWTSMSGIDAVSLAKDLTARGIRRFIYTDIARDGMLAGPAVAALHTLVHAVATPVIAAGGIGTEADLATVERTGVEGVIVGRALYEGRVDLRRMVARWGAG